MSPFCIEQLALRKLYTHLTSQRKQLEYQNSILNHRSRSQITASSPIRHSACDTFRHCRYRRSKLAGLHTHGKQCKCCDFDGEDQSFEIEILIET
jgi:hypothetical protein